ncbi:MAG: ATP-binding protein [Elusimicrobia bacterium]|nr:ATP-binding protein [Elusimicrobiota bacterium]
MNESDYQTLFARAPDGIMIMSLDGASLIVNDSFARMHGYAGPQEMARLRLSDLDTPESARLAPERLRRLAAGETLSFEVEHFRKDGSRFPLNVTCNVINIDGRPYFLGFHRDVADTRRREAALANMQKLDSLGTLAGGIAHDFNNLLAAILGNLSLLEDERKGGGKTVEYVREAQEACKTATGLSRQLLTFAKGGKPAVKVLDLRPLLRQASVFAARGSSARCVFALGDAPLAVSADPEQVAQVIQSVVLNAAQAMPDGGNIAVRAELVAVGADELPPLPAGRYVRVRVADQGPGIPPEDLPRLFELYFTTKPKGRGLGLPICHSIMARHGGDIAADPRPGPGAAIILHFPAADAAAIPSETRRPESGPGGGRILIMEDAAPLGRILKRMLERLGYRAEVVADGRAALDAYREAKSADDPFAAVIMDLTIPGGMGGKETMIRLRTFDPQAKAIVASGYSNDPIMSEYAAHGFSGALAKPFRIEELSEALRGIFGREEM